MTFAAWNLLVSTRQPELCPIVDKLRGRLPTIRGVTLLTLPPELVPMYVGMTSLTIAREAQIRMGQHQGFVVKHILRGDVRAGVALHAVLFPMFSLEAKPCLRVIKRLRIESDDVEIPSVMLFVAFDALPVRQWGMES